LQFDELPLVLLVLASGFVWFALRRYREAGATLDRQRVVDARLSAVLAENRRLAHQSVSAQESERRSVARELHDEMGQYLNAIKIDAVAIRDAAARGEGEIRSAAVQIVRNADHVYSVVGELIRRLRPIGLDELGLVAALENCTEQWRRRLPNAELKLSTSGDFSRIGEAANLAIYRIVQECLTNVAKHADARHVAIDLTAFDSPQGVDIRLRIADDGQGMDLRDARAGFGLVSMRERVEMQGGRFDIASTPGAGFTLSASFTA
jgi:signal transduction histidine kinase